MAFPKLLKRLFWLLGLTGVLGAGLWFAFRTKAVKPPEITTQRVTRGDLEQVVTAAGDLLPVTSVEVSSQISGLIAEVLVDYNTIVKKGQVLARIDPATYEQRLKQAQAELASSTANATLVSLNTERTRELFRRQLVTQQEVDQAEAQMAQAKAQLLIRNAAVEDARVNLSRCTIYAPIDGIVQQRVAEVGKTVAASLNAPTLFLIANDLTQMQIHADVAEADIGSVREAQSVSFTVDAFPGRNFKGRITQVRNHPKTQSNVVTYETIIDVNNDDLRLKPGMTANVAIVIAERKGVLRVPNSVLRVRVPDSLLAPAKPSASGAVAEAAPPKPLSEEERRKALRELLREAGFSRDGGPPSPEMLQKIQALAKAKGIDFDPSRLGRPGGGGGGGGGAKAAPAGENPVTTRTVFLVLAEKPALQLEAREVKLGITDGLYTEVLSGITESDTLVSSLSLPELASSGSAPSNPFAPRLGGSSGRR